MKKIIVLTHTDLDGVASPYFLNNMTKLITEVTGEQYEVVVRYGDISNSSKILNSDFKNLNNLSRKELNKVYYIAHDIGNIGIMPELEKLVKKVMDKGLNFSYIDHHKSENSDLANEKLDCMFYSTDGSMCASMMSFCIMLEIFSKKLGYKDVNSFVKTFDVKHDEIMNIFVKNLRNINNTLDSKKINYQIQVFSKMLDLKNISEDKIREFMMPFFKFIHATDFLDRRKMHDIPGLPLLVDYFNLTLEHTEDKLDKILSNMITILNSPLQSKEWNEIKYNANQLKQMYKPQDRVKKSLETMEFIKCKGESGKEYTIAVCFAESDIRYDLERNRFKMNEVLKELGLNDTIKFDAFITATRVSIDRRPIMTLKPCLANCSSLDIANDIFKDKSLILGTNAGIPIKYSEKVYELMAGKRLEKGNNINYILEEVKKLFDFKIIDKEKVNLNRELNIL